jgi:hypothetical protein
VELVLEDLGDLGVDVGDWAAEEVGGQVGGAHGLEFADLDP